MKTQINKNRKSSPKNKTEAFMHEVKKNYFLKHKKLLSHFLKRVSKITTNIFDLFEDNKITTNIIKLFKVSKMTVNILTCSKLLE